MTARVAVAVAAVVIVKVAEAVVAAVTVVIVQEVVVDVAEAEAEAVSIDTVQQAKRKIAYFASSLHALIHETVILTRRYTSPGEEMMATLS